MAKSTVFLLGAVLVAATTCRAEVLTLPQAVKEALSASPAAKKMDASVCQASWKRRESLSGFLPRVSAEGTRTLDARYGYMSMEFAGADLTMPQAYPAEDYSLTAQVTLFDGFRNLKAWKSDNLSLQAARLEREDGLFRLERQVTGLFYQALGAQALVAVARSRMATLEELRQITSARETRGAGTRYDRLRVETLLEEARASSVVADDNLALARRRLARAMGLENDERPLSGDLPVPLPDRLKFPVPTGTSNRSDLKAVELKSKALAVQSARALSGYWPKVALFGRKEFYRYGSFDPAILANDRYQSAYAVGLNLGWDLFDGGADLARSREIAFQAEAARQALREGALQADEDRETWLRRYDSNTQLYQARLRNIERAEESLRLARLGFKEGTQTNLDVLEAESDLYNARAGAIQAQLDAEEAFLRLETALGQAL